MSNYSKISTNTQEELWSRVSPLLDNYCRFEWAGHDMWEDFHAFILNESKGSLKFYNGPSYSNNYTSLQFESAKNLFTGVTFKTWTISFKIGVYAVTEKQYRKLIYALSPYEINNLIFAFQPDWRYVVKLSKVEDGTRYVIGKQGNEDLYYTEMSISFDIQGDACAYAVLPTIFQDSSYTTISKNIRKFTLTSPLEVSDIETPLLLNFSVNGNNGVNHIKCYARWNDDTSTDTNLFDLSLINISNNNTLSFEYNSQDGTLLWKNGDRKEVLSLLTTHITGLSMISYEKVNKFMFPGAFDEHNRQFSSITIFIETNLNTTASYNLESYGRTILI